MKPFSLVERYKGLWQSRCLQIHAIVTWHRGTNVSQDPVASTFRYKSILVQLHTFWRDLVSYVSVRSKYRCRSRLRNVGTTQPDYTASHPRKQYLSRPSPWKIQALYYFTSLKVHKCSAYFMTINIQRESLSARKHVSITFGDSSLIKTFWDNTP